MLIYFWCSGQALNSLFHIPRSRKTLMHKLMFALTVYKLNFSGMSEWKKSKCRSLNISGIYIISISGCNRLMTLTSSLIDFIISIVFNNFSIWEWNKYQIYAFSFDSLVTYIWEDSPKIFTFNHSFPKQHSWSPNKVSPKMLIPVCQIQISLTFFEFPKMGYPLSNLIGIQFLVFLTLND